MAQAREAPLAADPRFGLRRGYALIVNADPATGRPALLGEIAPDAESLTAFGQPWRHVSTLPLSRLVQMQPALHQALVACLPARTHPTRFLIRFDQDLAVVEHEATLTLSPAALLRYRYRLLLSGAISEGEYVLGIPEQALVPRRRQIAPRSRDHLQALTTATLICGSSFTGVLARDDQPVIPGQAARVVLVDRIEAEHTALLHDPACVGVLALRGSAADHFALIAGEHDIAYAVVHDAQRTGAGLDSGSRVVPFGTPVTLDAEAGELLLGSAELSEAPGDPSVQTACRLVMAAATPIDIRLNVDTAEEAEDDALRSASGVGLLRTEHMLRRGGCDHLLRAYIDGDAGLRRESLASMQHFFRDQLVRCFTAAGDKPVAVRLLDYPLHELGATSIRDVNPMLGLRGVRQGVRWPQLYLAQLDAMLAAASAVRSAGLPPPRLEILAPLVNSVREVLAIREMLDAVTQRRPCTRDLVVTMGAMIETPGAALVAADLARVCDFLSFGTNDLTQLTLGLSRDDYLPILHSYRQAHLVSDDPFTRIDPTVLRLVRDAAQAARRARRDIGLGVCGVHADDPQVLQLCTEGVLDYVSVPRNRLIVTRLRAITFAARRSRPDAEA